VSGGAGRYQLAEYRHGSIIGLALVDTEVGRTWTLIDVVDARGRKTRTEFGEVGVEGLWETGRKSLAVI
jgi:hypothetical protein